MRRGGWLGLLFFAGAEAWAGQNVSFQVEVQGVRSDEGQVRCSLYSSADGFPRQRDRAKAQASSAPKDGSATCTFKDVAPGDYAVAVFHDANGNGTFDTGFLGIPEEGVGYSNTPPKRGPPPKFDAAKVKVGEGATMQTIALQY